MIEFRQSRLRLFGLMLASIALSGLGVAVAAPLLPDLEPGRILQIAGWCLAVFFGLCALGWFWRFLTAGVTIRIGLTGLYDKRLCRETIPWAAIRGVHVQEMEPARYVIVDVDPAFHRRAGSTLAARLSRKITATAGLAGYPIDMHELDGSTDDLLKALAAFTRT